MTGSSATSTTSPKPLADAFDAVDRNDWRGLVDKALKGADFDRAMVSQTEDGLTVEPIYARDQAPALAPAPGTSPYTRGTRPEVAGLGWQIHQIVAAQDPQDANRTILEEVEAGANGIVLHVAAPGQFGLKLNASADVVTALTGVYLDLAPVQFSAGLNDVATANLFLDALPALGANPDTVCAHLNLDPIGSWARWGGGTQPIDAALKEANEVAKRVNQSAPKMRTIHVDATHAHEAGATEAQELALLAATYVAYLKAFEDQGVSPKDAFNQIAFTLSVTDDIFTSLAKLRAGRRIICRIADASGVDSVSIQSLFMTARTSERMLAKRDPWTNILRTTVACAAAAFAGTEAIVVHPFTWALGQPDAFARRLARTTQIVCQEESSLGRVVDPAGGSWYIESLTNDLAEYAWKNFQDIEHQGGVLNALRAGTLQSEIAKHAGQRDAKIAKRKVPLTGVSEFPLLGSDGVTVEPWPAPADPPKANDITPLTPIRFAQAFEDLRDTADAIEKKTGTPPRVFLANLGRIVDHNTRSTWIKNLLASGGIEALTNDGFENADAAAKAFGESNAKVACICSSDALYSDHAVDTAKALKSAGANLVLMAGKPGDNESQFVAAGVDQFLYVGIDVVKTLSQLLKNMD